MTKTEKEHIAKLEEEVQALQLEANGGKDLSALAKAEKDFHSFDIKVVEAAFDAIDIGLTKTQKKQIKMALVSDRYAKEVSKNIANEWGE